MRNETEQDQMFVIWEIDWIKWDLYTKKSQPKISIKIQAEENKFKVG